MVRLLGRGWRDALGGLAASAEREVLIAAPYIKDAEAEWFCDRLRAGADVTTLADIDADAVSRSTLDLTALSRLADASPASRLVSLANLHAKVFVADETAAIVTSGNLTRAGLDRNFEYGVLFEERAHVRAVRHDLLSVMRLGSEVTADTLAGYALRQERLREARADRDASASPEARQRFNRVIREARQEFTETQVGARSRNAMFGEAIGVALERGPRTTDEIHEIVRGLLPNLCDDSAELIINGARYGKEWKHYVRNAQQYLKRKAIVEYEATTREWRLLSSPGDVDR